MNIKKLPFTIGEQYELNEFGVKSLEEVVIGNYIYEAYLYIDNDLNSILGFNVKSIILFYNADILSKVKIHFYGNALFQLLNHLVSLEGDTVLNNKIRYKIFYSSISDETELEYFDNYV